ncbi:MAG: hypothetical protein RL539_597 [Pseudomonadota bacterium]
MKIFTLTHFLRHVSVSRLHAFTQAHPIAEHLRFDWQLPAEVIPERLNAAVADILNQASTGAGAKANQSVCHAVHLWHDDLRRVHLLSNDLAAFEFRVGLADDAQLPEALAQWDVRDLALWAFHERPQLFRDVELHLAFQAKANGRSWKKHRIEPGLLLTGERSQLEAFSREVAKLYEKAGAGRSTHIEQSVCASDGSVQYTIYVEGPITALSHFTEHRFNRVTTRIALETALVYQPATGDIESIVKGGAKNHKAVLQLFTKYLAGREMAPQRIGKMRYSLNELRAGVAMHDDLSPLGVDRVRLKRAQLRPRTNTASAIRFEASPEQDQDDALELARKKLHVENLFEAEYDLDAVCILVYLGTGEGHRSKRFSFEVYSAGSSTIKNLSEKNQPIAQAVLKSLQLAEPEEAFA